MQRHTVNGLRTHHETPTKPTANGLRSPTKWGANTPPDVGTDSSYPYPNITNYTYSHYQIRVYSLSNMHIHIINYVFSSHHAHIFALPYQYIRFFVIYNIEYKTTPYSIYIHVNCIDCFLGYFLIKIQNRALHSTLYICMHPNFVLTSGRNCVPIILPIPSVEPRFISPLYRFHTQNGGKNTCTPNFHSPKLYQTMHGQNNLLSRLPLHSHPICRNRIAFS